MKKNYLFLVTLLVFLFSTSFLYSQQRNEWVKQVISGIGGKFEVNPPFTDFVKIQSYDPSTQAVNVFNHINTQSVQDIVISGNVAYVGAQDSIVSYNLDTYQRIAAIADSGISKLYVYEGNLIVTKQYPITRFFVEVLDATNLGLLGLVDNISGECGGITSANNIIFVAVNGGWLGTEGKLALIDPSNWTLINEHNFGPQAIGIDELFKWGNYIFTINKTPLGAADTGSITRYNYNTNTFTNKILGVRIGGGYGYIDSILYLNMNEGMGSYNMDLQQIEDTVIVPNPGSANDITIHAGAIDYVNNLAYLQVGNRNSFGIGLVFTLTGDSVTSFATGINAEAIAIDYRTPTGINNLTSGNLTIGPNPAEDYVIVRLAANETYNSLKIFDLTGKTILSREISSNEKTLKINCSNYPSGIYVIALNTPNGVKSRKFSKK